MFKILAAFLFPFLVVPLTFSQNDLPEHRQQLFEGIVLFDFGKHELRPEADSVLQKALTVLADRPLAEVQITAHTDAIGTDHANDALSKRRAVAVEDYLIRHGAAAENIAVRVFGEKRPVAENDSGAGRQRNRRATITLFEKIPMTRLEGIVRIKDKDSTVQADIVLHSKTFRDSFQTLPDGSFERLVPEDIVIGIDVHAPGFFYYTQMLRTQPGELPVLEIPLQPVEKGAVFEIPNLLFVGNQAVLLEGSKPELPKLLKSMQLNPGTEIEIAGHVNYPNRPRVSTESWEYGLSVRRAKMVYEYLLANGINPERMTYKGYGNWEMVYPNARNEEEMKLNRRVEIVVK